MIAALAVQRSVSELRDKMRAPSYVGTHGQIYNTAGRYMRMCDALQQATLDTMRQKEKCWVCAKGRVD